jgi:hypothetical protein
MLNCSTVQLFYSLAKRTPIAKTSRQTQKYLALEVLDFGGPLVGFLDNSGVFWDTELPGILAVLV